MGYTAVGDECTGGGDIEVLNVSDCVWYYKLVTLLFGYASVFVGSLIYGFPAAPISYNVDWEWETDLEFSRDLRGEISRYAFVTGSSGLIAFMLTCWCLAFRMKE